MNDDQLKQEIKAEYEKIVPDLKARVLTSCKNTEQDACVVSRNSGFRVWLKRIAVCVACLLFFVGGAFVGFYLPTTPTTVEAETIMFLDVNPSVEITLDEDNKVLNVLALNDDAGEVLKGLQLKDVELNTALNAIVGSMYIHGYLTSEANSILVSIDTKHDENMNGMLEYVTDKINKVFEKTDLECSIIAQGVDVNNDLKNRAKEQGVSVGKMHLIDKLKQNEWFANYDIEDLTSMQIKDLNHIYSSFDKDEQNSDVTSGNVSGYISKQDAIDHILKHLQLSKNDVEFIEVLAMPNFSGLEINIKYCIRLKKKGDSKTCFYDMDCKTGEITEAVQPEGNQPPPQEIGGNHGTGGCQ